MKKGSYKKPFVIQIQDKTILFSADDFFSRVWQLTKFRNNRMHEEKVTNLLIEKLDSCKCFVDVGAHLGYYTFLVSKLMPDGIVYAFEMGKHNYTLLKKNLDINKCKNVNIYHAAVTDYSGIVSYSNTFRCPNPTLVMSTRTPQNKYSLKKSVQAISLDGFFKNNRLIPEIIKIDVEGAEMKVLSGMRNILENNNLQLFLEVHPIRLKFRFQSSANTVISTLIDKGYIVSEIKNMRRHGIDIKFKKLHRDSQIMHNTMIYAYR